jgi:very-short-patch-repair endonuclease
MNETPAESEALRLPLARRLSRVLIDMQEATLKYGYTKKLPRSRAASRNRADLIARMTKAERLFARALQDAGERFTPNFRVSTAEAMTGYYLVDFYLPNRRLLVEVDGGVHKSEARRWKDRLRTEAIQRARPGDSLARIWNAEVERDPAAALQRLLS